MERQDPDTSHSRFAPADETVNPGEAHFRALWEVARDGVLVVDAANRIRYANPAIEEIFGYPSSQLLGADLALLQPEHLRDAHRQGIRRYLQTRQRHRDWRSIRMTGLHRDGRELQLEISFNQVIVDGHSVFAGFLRDITEQQFEEARERARAQTLLLVATEAPLPEVLESIVLGSQMQLPGTVCSILLLDEARQHLLTGAAPGLPATYNAVVHGMAIGPQAGSCGTAAYLNQRVIAEDILCDPRWTAFREAAQGTGMRSCWSEPIHDADGNVLGTFAIYSPRVSTPRERDIEVITTSAHIASIAIGRDRSRRALQALHASLESQVANRTAELEKAMALARDASRAKSEFVSNMSHEIRTPMHSIIGLTHLVRQLPLDERQADYMDKLDVSARHLLRLVDDILDFSKIEAGKLEIERTIFNLKGMFRALAAQFEDNAARKGIRLNFQVDLRLPDTLLGDPARINQVLLNFVSNAIKFSDAGDIHVSAGLAGEAPDGILLRVAVTDAGVGLDDAQRERIFTAFEQGDGSITRRYGGTGLGLAISKQLIGMMGGEVGVDSRRGEGSTFWFTLPLGVPAESAPATTLPVMPHDIRGLRILLVEDNDLNQMVGRELLGLGGAIVTVAGNGAAALEILAQQPFDIVLMDMQMPVMDGLEAARRMQADPALRGIPVVAMTANAESEERERCLAAGMVDFVSKPFAVDELYATIARRAKPGP